MVSIDPFAAYTNIERHDELNSPESEKMANNLCIEGRAFHSAIVVMNYGLLLLKGEPTDYRSPGVHFAGANCGYNGTGVRAAAYILALFNFGEEKELFAQLQTADRHTFSR